MRSRVGNPSLTVTDACFVEQYTLRITFSDGMAQKMDFGRFLTASTNPMIRKYLDPKLFQNFTVRDGDLFWNDYDLCFPVADLYENTI